MSFDFKTATPVSPPPAGAIILGGKQADTSPAPYNESDISGVYRLSWYASLSAAVAATVAFAQPRFRMITGTSGDVVDITLRLGGLGAGYKRPHYSLCCLAVAAVQF